MNINNLELANKLKGELDTVRRQLNVIEQGMPVLNPLFRVSEVGTNAVEALVLSDLATQEGKLVEQLAEIGVDAEESTEVEPGQAAASVSIQMMPAAVAEALFGAKFAAARDQAARAR